jgi:hypothetical protein
MRCLGYERKAHCLHGELVGPGQLDQSPDDGRVIEDLNEHRVVAIVVNKLLTRSTSEIPVLALRLMVSQCGQVRGRAAERRPRARPATCSSR